VSALASDAVRDAIGLTYIEQREQRHHIRSRSLRARFEAQGWRGMRGVALDTWEELEDAVRDVAEVVRAHAETAMEALRRAAALVLGLWLQKPGTKNYLMERRHPLGVIARDLPELVARAVASAAPPQRAETDGHGAETAPPPEPAALKDAMAAAAAAWMPRTAAVAAMTV
jgi:hypothetical protein